MDHATLRSVSRSEWIKFRSVRSTIYSLATIVALTVGLGALINWLVATKYHTMTPAERLGFDPLGTSLVGLFFAEFVVGVVGAMFITVEYSTESIRTTLAAVPRRTLLVMSKILVMTVAMTIVCEVITFTTFSLNQAILASGPAPSYSLGSPGVVRAVALAGLFLVVLAGFGFSLGLLLRKTPAAIIVFVTVLLIAPILVSFLPSNWSGPIQRYLPSKLGAGMMSITADPSTYSPYVCALIMLAYDVILVGVGTYLLNVRDA